MGIDGLAQFLAFAFFLAAFAGVALVVAAASQGRSVRRGVILAVVGGIAGIFFMVVAEGLLIVQPTQRAVVFNTVAGELETPRDEGIHIIVPGIQQTTIYRVSQQNYTMSGISGEGNQAGNDAIEARSVDGQEVFLDVTVLYRIDADTINTLHRNWADSPQGYEDGLVRPVIRSVSRDVVATFQAEQIYGASREEVQAEINRRVTEQLAPEGLTVNNLLVREINFSDAFIEAIEAKQVEEQRLQRAETEAERVRTEARGQAEAEIERARGDAESRRIRAEAEAEALRLVSEQIAANPNLLQYTYIQNLSDNVELALVPSNTPFLFDFDSFTQMGDDFQAPEVPQSSTFSTPEPDSENNGDSN
jgi:regulator of protease activity HflC (stomatin/prohibitin superfamily)